MYERSIGEIAKKFDLGSIYAFGSRASEIARYVTSGMTLDASNRSDVDIAVQPLPGARLSAQQRVHLMQAFEDLFGVPRVDLVMLPEANAFLALDIIRGELLYCHDLDVQAEEELYYLRKAADLAPIQRPGYRNRLVHFYDEVTQRELFDITVEHVQDIETVLDALLAWVHSHPDRIDRAL